MTKAPVIWAAAQRKLCGEFADLRPVDFVEDARDSLKWAPRLKLFRATFVIDGAPLQALVKESDL